MWKEENPFKITASMFKYRPGLPLTKMILLIKTIENKKGDWGPTEIWTRIAGFKVQSANHYTMGPLVTCDRTNMIYKSDIQGQKELIIYIENKSELAYFPSHT